jgi:Zn-dependent metalloprotease
MAIDPGTASFKLGDTSRNACFRNLLLSGLTGLAVLHAGAARAQSRTDPFAAHDAAKAAQAQSPVGAAHVAWAQAQLPALRLDPAVYDLRVINAATDDAGGTHARLQQYYQGLRVKGGTLITHADAAGNFQASTDALVRNITVGTTPRLSSADAVNIAARQPSHLGGYTISPRVELVVYARRTAVDAATGAVVAPTYGYHTDPDSLPDPVNATQLTRQLQGVALAYLVRTLEGNEGTGQGDNAWVYAIDANTGTVLEATPAASSVIGHGTGKFSGAVSFATINYNAGFRMEDAFRQFHTVDDDTSDSSTTNNDANNQWGDGLPFAGDASASATNRQTAMVDGHFGSTVYWDLMSNVFHRQGPDDSFYSVNVITHYKTNWNDAEYSYWSGNIHLGDGASRQALDCLGHENGHALNDFSVDFDSGGEPGGLNESNSDIWGAMTTFYLGGGAFASSSASIPNSGGSFTSVCSARNMRKPSNANSVTRGPDAWYPGIGNNDEHYVGQPNNRAFFFLAQGASSKMKDETYSPLLPWGMTGIGNQKAARIWFDALTLWMDDDDGYAEVRDHVLNAAIFNFGFFSPEVTAVANAYAGINVGSVGPGYPASPPSTVEHEPNNTFQAANPLTKPGNAVPAGAPRKLSVVGTGNTDDWYSVTLLPFQSMTARVNPLVLSDYDLEVYDGFNTLIGSSAKGIGAFDLVTWTAGSGFLPDQPQTFYIRVKPWTATASTAYVLDLDYL